MNRTHLGALWVKHILKGNYTLEDVPNFLYNEVEGRLDEIEKEESEQNDEDAGRTT